MFSVKTAKGRMPEHHNCIDCGINTAPGCSTREQVDEMLRAGALRADPDKLDSVEFQVGITEVYMVRDKVWKEAGMGARWRLPLYRVPGAPHRPQTAPQGLYRSRV